MVASLQAGHAATLGGVWGSSCALVAASLVRHAPGPLVVVWPHMDDLDDFCDDLALFTRVAARAVSGLGARAARSGRLRRNLRRAAAAAQAARPATQPPRLIVTSIQSLLQPVPGRDKLAGQTRTLRAAATRSTSTSLLTLAGRAAAFKAPAPSSCRASSRRAAASSTSSRPTGTTRCGSSSSATRSNRFAASRWPRQRSLASLDAIDVTVLAPSADDRAHFAGYLPPGRWFSADRAGRRWRKKGGTIWSGWNGRRIFTASRATLRRDLRGFRRSPRPACRPARWRRPATWGSNRSSGSAATSPRCATSSTRLGAGPARCSSSARPRPRRSGCDEIFAATQLAAAGRLHFPLGPAAKPAFAW